MPSALSRRSIIAALLGSAVPLGRAVSARPFDEVVESQVLRVAVYRDNAPFSDEGKSGPVGIDVDIGRSLGKALGVRTEIRIVDPSENVDGDMRLALWRGDLAASGLSDVMLHIPFDKQLEQRNELVFFTRPYAEQRLAIAYRKDALEGGYQGIADLEGRTVSLEGTGPADLMIQFADGGRYRDGARHHRNFSEAAAAFLAGETDFLGGSRAAVEAALAGDNRGSYDIRDLDAAGPIRPRWQLCGAVKTDSRDLAYRIGEALGAMASSGEMKAIYAVYGVSYQPPDGY